MAVGVGEGFVVNLEFEGLFGLFLSGGSGQVAEFLLPLVKLVFVATAEEDLADDEVGAVVGVIEHPVCDVVNVAALDFVADGIVNIEAGDFDLDHAFDSGRRRPFDFAQGKRAVPTFLDGGRRFRRNRATLNQTDVGFADGDEGGGFLVAFEEAFLEKVVVHADDADLEGPEAAGEFGDAAFEGETKDEKPVGVALVAAGLDGFGHGLFADGAEFGADVEVGFLFAGLGLVEAFGVNGRGTEAVNAGEDGLLGFVAGLDASGFEVLEDQVFKNGEFFHLFALAGEFLGGDGFVTLERLDREGAGHAQAFLVFQWLVVECFFGRRFVVGDAAKGDVRDLLVDETVADVVAAQGLRGIALFDGDVFTGFAFAFQDGAFAFLGVVEGVEREGEAQADAVALAKGELLAGRCQQGDDLGADDASLDADDDGIVVFAGFRDWAATGEESGGYDTAWARAFWRV